MAQNATRAARRLCPGALVIVASLSPTLAAAQSAADFFRGKAINITVGFSAGGGYDLHARVLARHFGETEKHAQGSDRR